MRELNWIIKINAVKKSIFLVACIFLVVSSFHSCKEDYCLECINPITNDYVEGCNDDLEQVQQTAESWAAIGYACQVYE